MVSQLSSPGLVKSTHYEIIFMNKLMNLEEENIINLTYKLYIFEIIEWKYVQ